MDQAPAHFQENYYGRRQANSNSFASRQTTRSNMQYPTQSGQNFPKRNVNFEYKEADFPSLDIQGKQIQELSVTVRQIQSSFEHLMNYTKMNTQQPRPFFDSQVYSNNYNAHVIPQQPIPQQVNQTFPQPSFNQHVQRNDAKK